MPSKFDYIIHNILIVSLCERREAWLFHLADIAGLSLLFAFAALLFGGRRRSLWTSVAT